MTSWNAVPRVPAFATRLLATRRDRLLLGAGAVVVAVALVLGGVLVFRTLRPATKVTAYFAETIGVYPGSTVRVLGVPVGTVDSVAPVGTRVKVEMTLAPGVKIPASAGAVVVAPSVVADRYVQLTPAYTGGPLMTSGAVIGVTRTMVPLEVDEVYSSLAKLATALGPNGANKNGALSTAIRTGAVNLAGNGKYLHEMLTEFGGLSRTLGGSSGNLFASLSSLQKFTTMLKRNGGQVRLAENQLAEVSGFLASDRADLTAAIRELAVALNQVKGFLASNRGLIDSNVTKLASITSILSTERASLAGALDDAPLAADNLVNAYDATRHTLDGRADLNEFTMGGHPETTSATQPVGPTGPAGTVPVPTSETSSLPPLPLPVVGTMWATPQAVLAGAHG